MNKAYLFDFDGTLVDSMPIFVSSMLRILDDNDVSYNNEVIKTITPLGLNGSAEYFINELGVNLSKEQLVDTMKKDMLDAYVNKIPAKKNVPEVLNELKNQGASLNVLTASPHISLDPCLKRLGLWSLFDNVWSCEDFHTTKANPQIYIEAAKKMKRSVNEVLFLDDNLGANLTAKKAGMLVCGVYDESSKDYVDEIKAATDFYIYNFKELLEFKF